MKTSLKQSINLITKKRGLFAFMFIFQIAFILISAGFFYDYSIKIMSEIEAIAGPLEDMELEPTMSSLEVLDEYAAVNEAYSRIANHIFIMLFLLFLTYILFAGTTWNFANTIVNKKKPSFMFEMMFILSTVIFALIGVIALLISLNLLSYIANNSIKALFVLLISIALSYFTFISFGLINNYKPKQLGKFLKHTFTLGYKKIKTLFPSYLFMILVIIFIGAVFYKIPFAPVPVIALVGLIFILALCWAKIFFLTVVKNTEKHIKTKK
ncbi:hypothetical protein KY332_01555 [Candidatus Woesearchaeota archaeon]|nr:hypothetical protein [Candidatus Woesearchaeota archaeon]